MIRAVILVVAWCTLRASAQPAICKSDQHCQTGFYCKPDAFRCVRCLDCEDLKREPPRVPTACIRSVAECGSCIKGHMNDLRGDVTAECVAEAGDAAGDGVLPAWAWVAVIMGLLLFVLVVVTVVYVLRNTTTFKILASTRASLRSPVRSPGVVGSTPEAPPPYRAHYHNHHNHHNSHDTDQYDTDTDTRGGRDHRDLLPDVVVDPSAPCDDGSPSASPLAIHKSRAPPPGLRESAARQATRFFSEPYYVRPPRYSDAGVSVPASSAPEPPSIHDEDTMESTWTAAAHDDNGNAAGGGELAELLAAARLNDQRLHHQHHHHLPCTQDSNNNRSSGAAPAGGDPSGPSTAGSAPHSLPHANVSYIINVVQNMQNRT